MRWHKRAPQPLHANSSTTPHQQLSLCREHDERMRNLGNAKIVRKMKNEGLESSMAAMAMREKKKEPTRHPKSPLKK